MLVNAQAVTSALSSQKEQPLGRIKKQIFWMHNKYKSSQMFTNTDVCSSHFALCGANMTAVDVTRATNLIQLSTSVKYWSFSEPNWAISCKMIKRTITVSANWSLPKSSFCVVPWMATRIYCRKKLIWIKVRIYRPISFIFLFSIYL